MTSDLPARAGAIGGAADRIIGRRRVPGWQRVCLTGLVAWSLLPLLPLAVKSLDGQGAITGAYGLHPGDQYQYLSWIRQAGEHGLIANRMDIGPAGHVFLHPMFLLSGLLWRAGATLPLAFLVWIPISTVVLFAGFRAYVLRWLGEDRRAAAAALVLGLFFSVPTATLIDGLHLLDRHSRFEVALTSGDVFAGRLIWGYPATAIAMGVMPLILLRIERIVRSVGSEPNSRRLLTRSVSWASAGAALMSWLHPWQGLALVLVIASLAAWARVRRPVWPLCLVGAAALMPVVYYWILGHTDPAWEIGQRQNSSPSPPVWTVAVAVGPLALCALWGVPHRPRAVGERLLILWPLAAIVTYVLVPAYPFHAMNGVTLPLAVLAVRAWPRLTAFRPVRPLLRRWLLAIAAIGVSCLPGVIFSCLRLRDGLRSPTPAYLLTSSQQRAFDWLQSHGKPGGVASRQPLGEAVPAFTDRPSWLAHPIWTRDYGRRVDLIARILGHKLGADAARRALLSTGARYLLLACGDHLPAADLPPSGRLAAQFGCVRVVQLRR